MPGELSQEIGRAYVHVFGGCLERAVRHFSQLFNVYEHPEKLAFKGFTGTDYSFDLCGTYEGREVFVECKGLGTGAGLLDEYKEFLAKSYCTTVSHARHRRDLFWFITNVPFGSNTGRALTSSDFVFNALTTAKAERAAAYLGAAAVDREHVLSLSQRITVGILTDSFIRVMGTYYKLRPGDSLWSAIKLIHGGRIPGLQFAPIAADIQRMNNLQDPNRVRSGSRLHLPWFGIAND